MTKLEQHHIDFLTSYKTLEEWAGFTLKHRTQLFQSKFKDKRIAVTCLRRLYLRHGIRRKKVRQEKHMPGHVREEFQVKSQLLSEEVRHAKEAGRKLVYLDEVNFTKRSVMTREWSRKNSNLAVDQKEIYTGYRSVIATMTEEGGIDSIMLKTQAIDSGDFISFLKKLRARHLQVPLALFMDNLKVHRSLQVRPWYVKLDILPIWNVGYSPEFNPIEAVFSKVKATFTRQRLNCLVRKIGFNADRTIKRSFKEVTVDHCAACVRKS